MFGTYSRFERFFSVKKGTLLLRAGYRAQDLSIAARMLYHLSYGGSTNHLVLNDVNSKSQVNKVDMVEFGYHGE